MEKARRTFEIRVNHGVVVMLKLAQDERVDVFFVVFVKIVEDSLAE